jgi:hypothetical protein
MNIINYVLSIPKNIDIYIYAPGAGGDFFSSLIMLSHKETKKLLTHKQFLGIKSDDGQDMKFKPIDYFGNDIFSSDIISIGKIIHKYGMYMESDDKIKYLKMVIFHSMINHFKKAFNFDFIPNDIEKNINFYKFYRKINIILCCHGFTECDEKYDSKINFELNLLKNEKNINFINLNPQTDPAKNVIINYCNKTKMVSDSNKVIKHIEFKTYKNMNLKFPFFDYMIANDFNSIKNYLENRYGPDLDHNFVNQALINYKNLRIDPYL